MIKVGHIIGSFGNQTGTGNAIYSLVKCLSNQEIEHTIYTEQNNINLEIPKNTRIIYYKRPIIKIFQIPIKLYIQLIQNKDNLDLLQLHSPFTLSNLLLSLLIKIPYIYTPHGCLDEICLNRKDKKFKKTIYSFLFEKKIVKKAAGVMVSTIGEQRDVMAFSKNNNIEIVHFPLKLEIPQDISINNFRSKYNFDKNDFIVLFIGRWDIFTKGLDILIDASIILKEKIPQYKCIFIGYEVDAHKSLEKLIREKKMECVCLLIGKVYGEEKFEALLDCNIYCQPSRYESFGMSIIESLQLSRKTLITDRCKISDYVNNEPNIIISNCDVSSIANSILTEFNNKNNNYYNNRPDLLYKILDSKKCSKIAFEFYEKTIKK
jgi:Glycosyltransferase